MKIENEMQQFCFTVSFTCNDKICIFFNLISILLKITTSRVIVYSFNSYGNWTDSQGLLTCKHKNTFSLSVLLWCEDKDMVKGPVGCEQFYLPGFCRIITNLCLCLITNMGSTRNQVDQNKGSLENSGHTWLKNKSNFSSKKKINICLT